MAQKVGTSISKERLAFFLSHVYDNTNLLRLTSIIKSPCTKRKLLAWDHAKETKEGKGEKKKFKKKPIIIKQR